VRTLVPNSEIEIFFECHPSHSHSTSLYWRFSQANSWDVVKLWNDEEDSRDRRHDRHQLGETAERIERRCAASSPACRFISMCHEFLAPRDICRADAVNHYIKRAWRGIWKARCQYTVEHQHWTRYRLAHRVSGDALYPTTLPSTYNQRHRLWKTFFLFLCTFERHSLPSSLWPIIKLCNFPFSGDPESPKLPMRQENESDITEDIGNCLSITPCDKPLKCLTIPTPAQPNDRYVLKKGKCGTVSPRYRKSHRAKSAKGAATTRRKILAWNGIAS
jgi:hypothetical protein